MERSFSRKQKNAIGILQDRNSTTLQGDHITPFSREGNTDVENGQLLSRKANAMKSNNDLVLRRWQQEFINKWDKRKAKDPFLLVAIPAGGKTIASLYAANEWMQRGTDRRLVVVVPTNNLQGQWQDEALCRFGMQLQTKEFGTNFKHGFQGAVACYPTVAKNALTFRKLCSTSPTMVILDEPHHCGRERAFGIGVEDAFVNASEMLLISGTPWQTDGTPIPFVRYDANGYCISDHQYDYPEALHDEVVRWLAFEHHKGTITNDITGQELVVSGDITTNDAELRLSKLLSPDEGFCEELLRKAHKKLTEIRRSGIADAGGMVACSDTYNANKIARVLKKVTGIEPSIIVSDSDVANDSVKEFRDSDQMWVVCVRQVSEGTDIKRLMVLAYLTNYATELFFRQLVGRICRVRGIEDDEAYVFLPADPRLIAFSQNIENAQVQCLREMQEKAKEKEQAERDGDDAFGSYSTTHDGVELVLIGNVRYAPEEADRISLAAAAAGISLEKAANVIAAYGKTTQQSPQPSREIHAKQTLEEQMDNYRRKCNKLAFRISKRRDVKVQEIHVQFKQQAKMSKEELEHKMRTLNGMLANS